MFRNMKVQHCFYEGIKNGSSYQNLTFTHANWLHALQKKWAGTTDMAPPGNYQIKTLVTDPRYIYSEP